VTVALALTGSAAASAQKWTPEESMKLRNVGGVQVAPDGKRVAFTVTRAVMEGEKSENQTHVWMAASDGSGAYQFTHGEKSCTNPAWSPDGKWIAFLSSRSGKNNVWVIATSGGEAEQLTDVKSSTTALAWSPDGRRIAFLSPDAPSEAEEKARKEKNDAIVVDENFKMTHIWLVPLEKDPAGKREARQLTKGEFNVFSLEWSPDGKNIAFTRQPTPRVNDWPLADISTVDTARGAVAPLAATAAAENAPLYSPDGKWVAFIATEIPPTWGGSQVVHVAAAGGGAAKRLAETPDRQATLLAWAGDGKSVYVGETRGTVSRIYAVPVDGSAPREITAGDGVMGSVNLSPSRTHFGFSWQEPAKAPEAYVTPVDAWKPVQISRVNAELAATPLGRTEVVRWKSKDGWEIEGLLTYPVDYQAGQKVPLLTVIHGGPAGVFTQSFLGNRGAYNIASFAAAGYAVLRPNPRGSSGYGHRFRHANYRDWGGMDYQDIMTGVDHVIALGVTDADRLGVMGWSYGGFMTSWVITQTKRFKAASIGAPVTNLMSFNGTADIPSFVPDYMGVEFWDNLEIYKQHSAMFNIKGAATPSLIQHGEADDRVHIEQGMQLYNALKRQGVPVKFVRYPRQPHGVTEPRLLLDVMKRNVEWFTQWVK
jgi:dipeptidyl aminopeptidase/acylaminoacyl peptidase